MVTAVLSWGFSPDFGVGRWQCSVESALKDRLELPRNEEQGNVEVSLLDFCLKKTKKKPVIILINNAQNR